MLGDASRVSLPGNKETQYMSRRSNDKGRKQAPFKQEAKPLTSMSTNEMSQQVSSNTPPKENLFG